MDFGIVLKEKYEESGLIKSEVMDLFNMLSDTAAYPIEINAKIIKCSAMGFITPKAADILDYDYEISGLNQFITNILENETLKSEDGCYEFRDIKIWLN